MSTMETQIQQAIRESLPQQVGEELQKLLRQAKSDREKLVDVEEKNEHLQKRVDELREFENQAARLNNWQKGLEARNTEMKHRELRIELEELKISMLKERVKDMKEVVSLVFQNNRYKYSAHGRMPAGLDEHGYAKDAHFDKDVSGEY